MGKVTMRIVYKLSARAMKLITYNPLLKIIAVFFIAFLIRLLLIPNPGFEADVAFWKSWSMAAADKGAFWSMYNTNNNYPAPFAYIMWAIGIIYRLFGDPHNFYQYWANTNVWFLAVAKLPSILADFGIALLILWIGKNAQTLNFPKTKLSLYCLLAFIYLFNPVSVIDGAWWGQVDSLGVFIFLVSIIFLLSKKPFLAGLIYIAAVMTKLQNMIYGPIFFLFLWQTLGYQGLIKGVKGAVCGFIGLNIEFLLARDSGRILRSLTQNYDYFPLLSLNAFNPWWIVAKGHGMQVSDKILALGITCAKTLGLLIFSSFYLFAVLRQILNKAKSTNDKVRFFIEGLVVINASFFLFQTQSHDRYMFPLSVFLLLLTPFIPGSKQKFWLLAYIVWSVFYFYNLHTALIFNYPNNGLMILSNIKEPVFTISVSIILTAIFFAFIIFLVKRTHAFAIFITLSAFVLGIFKLNYPLITKKPVPLSSLAPAISQQSYGQRVKDMPVNASLESKTWTPLSVQYAFYRNGIGTHANSVIDYDLGGNFRSFTTDFGIDTEAGERGSAVFEIYGDGKLLFRSPKIGRFDLPGHTEVNVSGVRRLGLVTTDAGDGINDDHTDWLNPTLWP